MWAPCIYRRRPLMIKPSQPGFRPWENRPASLCSCNGFPLARFAGLPPQAVAEQPVLIVVQLMKGLLCESLLSHRSAGGRWCRKAPKGECISSPAGRLYGFIQTGAFYNLEAPSTTLSGRAAVSRVDGIRLLCPPLTEPYVRVSRIRLLE